MTKQAAPPPPAEPGGTLPSRPLCFQEGITTGARCPAPPESEGASHVLPESHLAGPQRLCLRMRPGTPRSHLLTPRVREAGGCVAQAGAGEGDGEGGRGAGISRKVSFLHPRPLTLWSLLHFATGSPPSLCAGAGQPARAGKWWHVSLHSQDGIFTAAASGVALLS